MTTIIRPAKAWDRTWEATARRSEARHRLLVLALACLCGPAACQTGPSADELFLQARLEYRKRDYPKAQRLVDETLNSPSLEQGSELMWRLRILQAEILQEVDSDQAEALLGQIEASLPEGRFKALDVRILMLRGLLSEDSDRKKGFYEQARSKALALADLNLLSEIERLESFRLLFRGRLVEAIAASRPIADRTQDQVECFHFVRAYNNLAFFHKELQQWDEARNWVRSALPCARQLQKRIPSFLTVTLLNLGTNENRLGRLDEAQAHLEEALNLAGPGDLPDVLLELGNNFFFRGDWVAADAKYNQALKAVEQRGGRPRDQLKYLGNLASTWQEARDCQKARSYAKRATELAEQITDPGKQAAVRRLLNQSRLEAICGNPAKAEAQLKSALQLSGDYPGLQWRIYFSLADLYREQEDWEKAYTNFEKSLQIIDRANQSLSDEGDRMTLFSQLIGIHRSYVYALIQGSRQDRALEVADASRARLLREQLGTVVQYGRIGDFQRAAAQSGRAFLSYWLSQLGCYLWVITPEKTHFIQLEAEVSEIRALVGGFQGRLEGGDDFELLLATGSQLFELLVKPALEHLEDKPRVTIVADDVLHQLSFDALPAGDRGSPYPWIEDATISMAPSLGAIAAQPVAEKISLDSALLIDVAASPDPDFKDLEATKKEVDEIEKRLKPLVSPGSLRRLTSREANPDSFMQANHQANLIHFAAHAEANSIRPLSSAILLNPWRGVYRLYAKDIQKLDLNAQLVTLSACQTVGEAVYSGEGPVGFAWAFLSQGAWNVVASQWKASDEATAEIMGDFYKHLILNQGRSPDEALRDAKLAYLRSRLGSRGYKDTRPRFWALFQIYTRQMVR